MLKLQKIIYRGRISFTTFIFQITFDLYNSQLAYNHSAGNADFWGMNMCLMFQKRLVATSASKIFFIYIFVHVKWVLMDSLDLGLRSQINSSSFQYWTSRILYEWSLSSNDLIFQSDVVFILYTIKRNPVDNRTLLLAGTYKNTRFSAVCDVRCRPAQRGLYVYPVCCY